MGNYNDFCATIRPRDLSVESVVRELEELVEGDVASLPAPSSDVRRDLPDGGYEAVDGGLERDALTVDRDDRQAYLGGRTFSPLMRRIWEDVVVQSGVGDGALAVVVTVEVEYVGIGMLYEWTGSEYEPVADEDCEYWTYDHYAGDPGLKGVDLAEAFAERRDVRPARYKPMARRSSVRKPDDERFVPDSVPADRTFDV